MIVKSRLCSFDIPENVTVTDYILRAADATPDRRALIDIDSGKIYTYKNLKRSIHNAAWSLHKRGVQKGDVVLFCSPNGADYVIMYHAVLSLGGIVTPVNNLFSHMELGKHLSLTNPAYIFTNSSLISKIEEALKISHKNPTRIFLFDHAHGYESCQDLISECNAKESKRLPVVRINCGMDLAVIPSSSGTTGLPKAVMLTHQNLVASLLIHSNKDISFLRNRHETVLFVYPLAHIFGIGFAMNYALSQNATLILSQCFEMESFLASIQNYKVTTLPLLPQTIALLATHPSVDKYDLSSVESATYGGSSAPEHFKERMTRRLGGLKWFRQAYGLTETSLTISMNPWKMTKPRSVGIVVPNAELKVIHTNTGEALSYYEEGEICARGPHIMKGYLINEKATAECIDEQGWFHTGDMGFVDKDEYIFISGRIKELIKYNTYQVSPLELESVLLTHPAVADVAVIGVPDEFAGELPRAYVVRKDGTEVTDHEIYEYAAERTSPHKKLRGGIKFISEIPKTPTGKIMRREFMKIVTTEQRPKSKI